MARVRNKRAAHRLLVLRSLIVILLAGALSSCLSPAVDLPATINDSPDPGSGWQAEEIATPDGRQILQMTFIDDLNGRLNIEGKFFRTIDGGKTFSETALNLPDQAYIKKFVFVDKNEGWLIAQKHSQSFYQRNPYLEDPDFSESQFWVLRTSDGGVTWQIKYTSEQRSADDIAWSGGKIYVYGDMRNRNRDKDSKYVWIYSGEHGENWTDISDSIIADANFHSIDGQGDFVAEGLGQVQPAGGKLMADTSARTMILTGDDGKSWRALLRDDSNDAQTGIRNFGYLDNGSFWMIQAAYSIEGVRTRLTVKNNWGQREKYVAYGVYLPVSIYLGGTTFIAAGSKGDMDFSKRRGVLFLTNDNGKSWNKLYTSSDAKFIGTLSVAANGVIWASTDNGTILRFNKG